MKKIALVTGLFLVVFSCNPKEEKQKQVEEIDQTQTETQTQLQTEECIPRRYQLCDTIRNNFTLKNNVVRIKLNIPVTSDDLKLNAIKDISNDSLNAILVHLKGNPSCTPLAPVSKFIPVDTVLSELNRYRTRLQNHDSLLVYIYNNDNSDLPRTNDFSRVFRNAKSYSEAIELIRRGSRCDEQGEPKPELKDSLLILQPKEQDGDVIGGNG
ncbi:MAG: hypothetical protein AAGD88_01095 [Bacteroidota bacterium]